MKTRITLFLLLTSTAALASAGDSPSANDAALQKLVRHGSIPVAQAGPYVAPGTFRIQVSLKLGRPDLVLADGTWLYDNRRIAGSEAAGTLVVRFNGGRVSALTLVTPAVATALRTEAQQPGDASRVATN